MSTMTAETRTTERSQAPERRRGRDWTIGLRFLIALIATAIFVAPILWMIATAFKTSNQAFSQDPVFIFSPTLDSFQAVISGSNFGYAVINSLQVSIISSLLAIIF